MRRKGFTLIELSIVLVIIGLLVGGVLKGKGMIDNAKMKRVKGDIDGIMAAVYSYQDKFGYLPGDDPTNRVTDLGAASCDGNSSKSNANGLFDLDSEKLCAWQEMIGAGFIAGNPGDHSATVAKKSPYGGSYGFDNNTTTKKNYISISTMPADAAQALDTKYDDGAYDTGDIQADSAYTTLTTAKTLSWYAF
ncbi:MAG: prepilin-type N-terminal cleavage/methylation domain-containing protein [Campylobacterales bacterium]|nr:prepilin-type N-terminal cleavage/methylation domain-containing protein [Campylobacterales bacterium]